MDTRTLSVTFLVFFMIWANADARKIVIFQNTDAEIPVKGRLSIRFLEFPNIEGIGMEHTRQISSQLNNVPGSAKFRGKSHCRSIGMEHSKANILSVK